MLLQLFKCKALLLTHHSQSSGITTAHYCSLSVKPLPLCLSRQLQSKSINDSLLWKYSKRTFQILLSYQTLSFQWHLGRFFFLIFMHFHWQDWQNLSSIYFEGKGEVSRLLNYSSNHKSRAQSSERCGAEWYQNVLTVFPCLLFFVFFNVGFWRCLNLTAAISDKPYLAFGFKACVFCLKITNSFHYLLIHTSLKAVLMLVGSYLWRP